MVSVCMATYNGERFIKQQIDSILAQMQTDDELIVSDDGSTDRTVQIINSIGDQRIKLFQNSFKNVVKNFEFSIEQSAGDIVLLSDQDDVWHPEKMNKFLQAFSERDVDMVVSDVAFIDQQGNSMGGQFYERKFKAAVLPNLIKNNFIGCAIAFKKHTKEWFLPFPNNLPMHDWWIGLVIGKKGKIYFLPEKLIFYRRHGNNFTSGKKSAFTNIIKWRWILIKNLLGWEK